MGAEKTIQTNTLKIDILHAGLAVFAFGVTAGLAGLEYHAFAAVALTLAGKHVFPRLWARWKRRETKPLKTDASHD